MARRLRKRKPIIKIRVKRPKHEIDDMRPKDTILSTQGFLIANVPSLSMNNENRLAKHGRYIVAYPVLNDEHQEKVFEKMKEATLHPDPNER